MPGRLSLSGDSIAARFPAQRAYVLPDGARSSSLNEPHTQPLLFAPHHLRTLAAAISDNDQVERLRNSDGALDLERSACLRQVSHYAIDRTGAKIDPATFQD